MPNTYIDGKTGNISAADLLEEIAGLISEANPVLSVTYNTDGTVASTTEDGSLSTFTYNTDGTVHTVTRSGITRTFRYNADGTISGAN